MTISERVMGTIENAWGVMLSDAALRGWQRSCSSLSMRLERHTLLAMRPRRARSRYRRTGSLSNWWPYSGRHQRWTINRVCFARLLTTARTTRPADCRQVLEVACRKFTSLLLHSYQWYYSFIISHLFPFVFSSVWLIFVVIFNLLFPDLFSVSVLITITINKFLFQY